MTENSPAPRLTLRCQFCDQWNAVDPAKLANRPKCASCSRPMLLDRPWILHKDSFARTIAESPIPVLVDFYADWCGPCRAMAPTVDELALNFQGRALVAKLNTDTAQEISQGLGIRGIPTVIVFSNGKEIARETGAHPYAKLASLIPN